MATAKVEADSNAFKGFSFISDGNGGTEERINLNLKTLPIPAYGVLKDQKFENTHAMAFQYKKGGNWSELRFDLGKPYKEIWIRYWMRVPTNFEHKDPGNAASNNKLFAIWMDDYSQAGTGTTAVWEYWRDYQGDSELAWHYRDVPTATNTGHGGRFQFIRIPEDRGRWMQIVLHLKVSSSTGAEDGLLEMYRRWSDEDAFTRHHHRDNTKFSLPPGSDFQGWQKGYFMGWANSGWDEETFFLIDGVEFSETELLDVVGTWSPISPSSENLSPTVSTQ